jgi:hypothetical protein
MRQWHPLFAELLRPLLEGYYEVETNMPVGDLPRQADIVLVRRTSDRAAPFTGLWRHLTTWNVLEFKGPSEDARHQHLHELVEVGLGIFRRMNEGQSKERQRPHEPEAMSFWYLAEHPGRTFLRRATERLGALDEIEAGVWGATVLGHRVFIVRGDAVAVTRDSLPIHLLGQRPPEVVDQVGNLVVSQEEWCLEYGPWLAQNYARLLEDFQTMGRTRELPIRANYRPVIQLLGPKYFLDQMDPDALVRALDTTAFTPEQRAELFRRLATEETLRNLDVAALTPKQRADLMRRLQQAEGKPVEAPRPRRPRRPNA